MSEYRLHSVIHAAGEWPSNGVFREIPSVTSASHDVTVVDGLATA
jgi:hypothetical protein